MDCTLPGPSVHGILQASILEWIAIPFSRRSSSPRDGTQVCCIAGRFFTVNNLQWKKNLEKVYMYSDFPDGSVVTNPLASEERCRQCGFNPWVRISSVRILENSMDRGACQATAHGVRKSWTQLTLHGCICICIHIYVTESLCCTPETNTTL